MNEKVIRKTSDTMAAVWCVLYPNLNYPSYPMNVTLIVMNWQKNIQSNTSNISITNGHECEFKSDFTDCC